jgi:hypothetical protein
MRQRRLALGMNQCQLGMAAGYSPGSAASMVSYVERDVYSLTRVSAALDRLEAKRVQP